MKRSFRPALCLALFICAAAVWLTAPAFAVGSGTELDPYQAGAWADLQTALNAGGYVKLSGDVTAGAGDMALTVPAGSTVTLDLAGHKIDRALTSEVENGNVITVRGVLTVTDSSNPSTGTITGGYNAGSADGTAGGGVYVAPLGSFTLAGGAISGNKTGDEGGYGGGVHVAAEWLGEATGSFAMSGGTISDNSAAGGGGVYLEDSDIVFTMSGGTISGNTASHDGGGISFGNVTMSGDASITDNTGYRGGVYCNSLSMSENAAITGNHSTGTGYSSLAVAAIESSLSGNVRVTGNTNADGKPANVGVSRSTKLTIAGDLGGDALIGVTSWSNVSSASPVVFTNGLSGHGAAANFTSDQGYIVALSDDGEAQLTGDTVTFYYYGVYFQSGVDYQVHYYTYQTVCVAGDKVSRPADPTLDGYTFGGWYTDPACTQEYDFDAVVSGALELYPRWQRTLTADDVTLEDGTWTYNGAEQKPAVTVTGMTSTVQQHDDFTTGTLTEGTDYAVAYANNVNAGAATVTVTITGSPFNLGTVTKTFTIVPAKHTVSVSETTNGSVAAPATVSVGNAQTTVTLTATPTVGYTLTSLTYTPDGGAAHTVTPTKNNDGTFTGTFFMPNANVTVSAAFAPDPAHFSQNGDAYTIHTATGWDVFCDCLNDNVTYNRFSGKTVKLDANITVTRMAGSDSHDFCGVFDGDGHTITIDSSNGACAVFSHVSNTKANPNDAEDSPSAIKNLRVTGAINTSSKYAAGLVSRMWGNVSIENCVSSVTINSGVSGDGTHGGLVAASNGNVTITGCVFDGKLLTTGGTTCCGGFVGWGGATVTNSLYAPAAIGSGETEVQAGTSYPSATFVRNGSAGDNCYYTRVLCTAQGKAARTVAAGDEFVTFDFGTGTTYDVSGITAYTNGIRRGGVFYAGEDDSLSLTLGHSERDGYAFTGYKVSAGTLEGTDNPYALAMPDEDVTVTALYRLVLGTPTFKLPKETITIGESAFEGLPMTVVEIPSGCESIGKWAFKGCTSLTRIRIPASVTAIDDKAFEGCANVLVFGASSSKAEAFCGTHANCTFIAED